MQPSIHMHEHLAWTRHTVSEDKTQRPAWKDGRHERGLFLFSVSESKHHFGEDCRALNELSFINIHRSLLLSLPPYCDRLAARPNSLRSLRALTSRGDSRKRISTVKRNTFIWWEEIFMYSERDAKNAPAQNHAHLKPHFMSPVWLFYWLFSWQRLFLPLCCHGNLFLISCRLSQSTRLLVARWNLVPGLFPDCLWSLLPPLQYFCAVLIFPVHGLSLRVAIVESDVLLWPSPSLLQSQQLLCS